MSLSLTIAGIVVADLALNVVLLWARLRNRAGERPQAGVLEHAYGDAHGPLGAAC